MICRECGETWPAEPAGTTRRSGLPAESRGRAKPVIEAERRPLVTYSEGVDQAWAAKIEGDYWPEPPQPRRLPTIAAAMAAVIFLSVFLGGREAAVAALPDLAGLYAAVGLPVNLDGLAIEEVTAERGDKGDPPPLTVRGTIRNISGAQQSVPALSVVVSDSAATPLATLNVGPPARTIDAGATIPFTATLPAVAPKATEIRVHFRRGGAAVAQTQAMLE